MKQMKHGAQILLLLLTVITVACRQRQNDFPTLLTEADSVSASDPLRALGMLDSIAPLMSGADSTTQMYHALLRVKAQDRAYIRHTTDSQILPVISYFERHPVGDLLAWAYCYGGRVCRDLGDTPRALRYLELSLDCLSDGRNPDLRQRVLSQLGYVFYYQYLFDESRSVKRDVIAGDSVAGRYDRMVTCYADIARCYIAEEQYDSAVLAAHHAGDVAHLHDLTRMQPALDLLNAQVASYSGQNAEALSLIAPWLADATLADATPYLAVAIRALMATARYAEAEPLCRQLLSQPHASRSNRATALRHLSAISLRQGRQAEALSWQREAMALLDTMRQAETEEKVMLVGSYYRSQQRERQLAQLEREKSAAESRLYILCSVLVCALLAAGAIWLQYKRRQAEAQLSRERAITAFRSSDLCQRLYALCYAQHPIPPELWTEVEDYLSQSLPGFLPRLHQLTTFSETEWHLSLLTRLGFRNVDIATLLCKHRSAISQSKKRLYAKVNGVEGKAEDWDRMVGEF